VHHQCHLHSGGVGDQDRTLTVADSAATSPQTIALSGNGTFQGLSSIAVTPVNPSIFLGASQQFHASGTYTNGLAGDLTNAVTWTSSATTVATISASGLASSARQGNSTITATAGKVSGSTTLTVTVPVLQSISVTPKNVNVPTGYTFQYTATGTYSDNSTQDVTNSVTWTSSAATVVRITSAGVATTMSAGSTTIQATSGAITGFTYITVFNPAPQLTSITVTPANPSIQQGSRQQFTVTGTYSDNSTSDITNTAAWSSLTPGVATITSAGVATGLAAGMATIKASSGAVIGSTTLFVSSTGFTATGSLQSARIWATSTLLNNGRVLITGGLDVYANSMNTAEIYDPVLGNFTPTSGPMVSPRYAHTATLLNNGMVLLAGGAGSSAVNNTAELYDPSTGTFTATGSMTAARYLHTATLLNTGKVLIAGASTDVSAEVYDPATATFTPTNGSLITSYRQQHTATLLNNGMVLIAGGTTYSGFTAIAELYDPTTGTFVSANGAMITPRYSHIATLLNGGMVLFTGGVDNTGNISNTAELYDPASQTFAPVAGGMTVARVDHQAALLNNGKVLVAGGYYYNGPLDSTELYDPASGTFAPAGNMVHAHKEPTLTLLNNGNVLIAGGENANGNTQAAAELYEPDSLTPAGLVSITVSPANQMIPQTSTQQFTAIGTFSNGTAQTLASVLWTSSNTAVATMTNDASNHGVGLPAGIGTTNITATAGTITGSTTLAVMQ
jgi:hypothetical protein